VLFVADDYLSYLDCRGRAGKLQKFLNAFCFRNKNARVAVLNKFTSHISMSAAVLRFFVFCLPFFNCSVKQQTDVLYLKRLVFLLQFDYSLDFRVNEKGMFLSRVKLRFCISHSTSLQI